MPKRQSRTPVMHFFLRNRRTLPLSSVHCATLRYANSHFANAFLGLDSNLKHWYGLLIGS